MYNSQIRNENNKWPLNRSPVHLQKKLLVIYRLHGKFMQS